MNKIYSNQARQIGILKPIANLCNGLSAFSFQLFVLFALALQLLSFRSNAQQYPVQVTPVLLPPYSLRLADYATTTDTKLQLYLLMRDLLEPSHQVRLRFSLESGINASPIAYSTPLVTGFKDVTLYPGTPLVLTNVDLRALFDLQNLSGISASDYARPLPQGIYRFSFQAFDAITQRTLSAKSFATAYFVQYDPPRLSLPQQGEKVLKQNEFQRIIFQWMPSQVAPNTKYIFTLKELWDNERDPVAGFLSSRALWQEEVYPNTLLYGIDKTALIPGKRYAWQVQAKSGNLVMGGSPTEDNGVYRNNGLSEIFYFDYVENCLVPSFLMAKNVGRGRTEVRWNVTGSKPDGLYRIQYRKRGSTGAWEQQESYQEMATITGLEDVTAYEYRVGSVCGNLYQTNSSNPASGNDPTGNAYAYSGIQNFTTDARGSQNTNYQCGVMPPVDITNSSPLQTALGVNEVFMAGDFPVTVLEAQGSNGTYSGKGYIQVPYLADTRIKVEFNNIRLNTDMKLIGGVIETSYDPNETSVKFVSDGIGETFGDQGIKEVKVAYTISKIEYVATPPPGKIVVSGNSGTGNASDTGSGTPSQQELPAGKDYAIIDKSGKIWNVDESGVVTESGQEAKGGTSTAANTQGVTGTGSNTQVSGYTAKGIKIKWQESSLDTTFAFDTEEKTKLGEKGNYPKLKDADGNTVYVPFKAVVNGQTGYLDAKISIGDPSLKDAEIIFKTLKVGKAIDAKLQGKTDVERTYQLTLKGVMDYAEEEVLAVLMPKDSTSKQQVIGSFRLVHLSPKTVKVTLVPTDEASKAKLKAQGEELKRIYGKIGVKIEIKEDPILDISSVVSGNTINSEDAELMSTYSEQQQQINALYKGTDDRYVVFVTSKTSSTGQSGYMRLNGQFGYVYQNATGKTTAHELGHGVFKLEHPWKAYGTTKGTTNLLMDYSNGDELSHLEWKQVNDPALKIYSFQGQSRGEIAGGFAISPNFKLISNGDETTVANIGLAGKGFLGGFVSTKGGKKITYRWENNKYVGDDNSLTENQALEATIDTSKIYLFYDNDKTCSDNKFLRTVYNAELKKIIGAKDTAALSNYIDRYNKPEFFKKETGSGLIYWDYVSCRTSEPVSASEGLLVKNLIKGEVKKEVLDKLTALMSGSSKNWITGESHHIKGRILLTSDLEKPDRVVFKDNSFYVDNVKEVIKPDEIVFWLEYNNDGNIKVKQIISGNSFDENISVALKAWESSLDWKQKTLFEKLISVGYQSVDGYFTAYYDVFDMLSSGVGKLKIKPSVYNCNDKEYNEIYATVFSYISLSGVVQDVIADKLSEAYPEFNKVFENGTPSQIQFALFCGMYNGLIDVVTTVPDLAKLLVSPLSSKGREANSKFLTQIEEMEMFEKDANGKEILMYGKGLNFGKVWYLLKEGVAGQFDAEKPCVAAEFVGSIVGPIIVMCAGDVAAGTGIMSKVASTSFKALQLCDKFTDPFRYIGMSFRFVKGISGKVGVVISNTTSDIITQLENGLFRVRVIANNTELPNLEMPMQDVTRLAEAGVDGIDYTVHGVNQRIKLIGSAGSVGTANPATISAQIFGVANEQLLKRFADLGIDASRLDKVLAALGKTVQNGEKLAKLLEQVPFKDDIYKLRAFLDDINASTDLQDLTIAGKDFSKEWNILEPYQSLRKLGANIEKMTSILNKGHISANDLTTILTVNKGLGKRAADLANFLDDLDHFALYKNQDGFDALISGLKANWFTGAGADGANWVIAAIRKEGEDVFVPKKTNFEVSALGNTRRYDAVVGDVGTKTAKYFEFKSYTKVPPSDFAKQFLNDLNNTDIDNLDNLKWLFDKGKNPPDFVNNMKNAIENMDFTSITDKTLLKFDVPNRPALKSVIKVSFDKIFRLK